MSGEGRRLERCRNPVSPWRGGGRGSWGVSTSLVAGAPRCSTNEDGRSSLALLAARPAEVRWLSSEGRRLERRRNTVSPWRTAGAGLGGLDVCAALLAARSTRLAAFVGNWRSSLLAAEPVVEQRGPKARASSKPGDPMAYSGRGAHGVSTSLLAGARRCSTHEDNRSCWRSSLLDRRGRSATIAGCSAHGNRVRRGRHGRRPRRRRGGRRRRRARRGGGSRGCGRSGRGRPPRRRPGRGRR